MGDRFVNVLMPEVLADSLQKVANEYGISRSAIVRIACSEFLKGKRILGVSELPGPSDGSKYFPVPLLIVEPVVERGENGE